ncbi:MAG: amino acid permease [Paraglaciecola sp.]|uniref:amino acid permease n=1 Tax=Paraglaciecola sp. TaxID=1920173 RepID=UPI00329A6887
MPNNVSSLLIKKNLVDIQSSLQGHGLKKTLGPFQLILIGLGCIIGAGVYVMTGTAAAQYAGPAIILSFVLAGLACGFTALCYAELSSVIPVSGASYSYAYTSLGEAFAWTLGWMLMLEFWLAGSALAAGAAGYFTSLLSDFGVHIPKSFSTTWIQQQIGEQGTHFEFSGGVNLIAVATVVLVTLVLVRGVSHSAAANTVMVIIKIGVLVGFVVVGWSHVDTDNWLPLIPENEGGFTYGVPGIFRAASILFFSYLGFEAVATAALEAKKPQRDIPIGIMGAMLVSTLVYIAVALVMTGLVPFKSLGVPDPIAIAVDVIQQPLLTVIIKIGALTGLVSVLLVNTYAHSRVCYSMSHDGLLPKIFSVVHPRFKTPYKGTIIVALLAAIAAAILPISILADLVSIGTTFVFSVVAISLIWLRTKHPELERPFKVPFGGMWIKGIWFGVVPVCALIFCFAMMAPVLIDIGLRSQAGDWIPGTILVVYMLLGAGIYGFYGHKNSALRLSLQGL